MLRDVERRARARANLRQRDERWRGVTTHRTDAPAPPPRYPRGPECPTLHGDRPSRDRTRGASSSSTHGPHGGPPQHRARPSSSASSATASRRASIAATSSRPTPAAELIRVARRSRPDRHPPLDRQAVRRARPHRGRRRGRLRPPAGRDRDPRELALGRGPPRPDAPGDLPPGRRQPAAPRLRRRGHAARRADRGPSRPRRREGRPDPPHVLGPARGVAPARRSCSGWDPDRLLEAGPPVAGRVPGGGRAGVRDDAGASSSTAIDGCGVETYAFPLREVARAYAMLADPGALSGQGPAQRGRAGTDRDPRRDARRARRWSAAATIASTPRS